MRKISCVLVYITKKKNIESYNEFNRETQGHQSHEH